VLTAKGSATRRRIIEAAAEEIRQHGATVTTLDDVCRRSKTAKGQVFHYFPDGKEQVLVAVAELEAERVFDDQEPYLGQLTSRAAWEAWRGHVVRTHRDQGLHCPLGVLIVDLGRYSVTAQAVSSHLVTRWQQRLRVGIEATQAAGEADPALDPGRTAAAVIAAIQGGVAVLRSTGSAENLEAGLDLCLDRIFGVTSRPAP